MAKQKGILRFTGQMGGVSMYTQNGVYLAKSKSSLDPERLKSGPEFVNSRKNNAEFSQASQAGKLIRDSFAAIVHNNSSNIVSGLTTARALLVVQSDQSNVWGERLFSLGDQQLMAGYEFNNKSTFGSIAPVPYVFGINRTTGAVTLDYDAFIPEDIMQWPEGATDCSFTLMAGEMGFDTFTAVTALAESAKVPLDGTSTNLAVLTATVTAASTLPLYAIAGIKFFKKVGAVYNLLKNRAYDASYVIGIDA